MASGLDADEKTKWSGCVKQAGTPLPPFCVSAHSRRLRPFILLLRVPAVFVEQKGPSARRIAWPKSGSRGALE